MRLIDVDKVEINEECTFSGKGIKAFLDAAPTAYNVDKVVERLRKEISDCMCEYCDRYTDCDTCRAEKAVEIVKSGGIGQR